MAHYNFDESNINWNQRATPHRGYTVSPASNDPHREGGDADALRAAQDSK